MPRRRRLPKARIEQRDGLRVELLDTLLHDHPAHDAEVPPTYDRFYRFFLQRREVALLRREHHDLLVVEARRRGLGPDHVDRVAAERSDAFWLHPPELTADEVPVRLARRPWDPPPPAEESAIDDGEDVS